MGDFMLVIEAAGGHGCERQLGDGDQVYGCGSMGCPDCRCREFVKVLQGMGVMVHKAELTHWPNAIKNADGTDRYPKEGEVHDDLLTRIRIDHFPEYKK